GDLLLRSRRNRCAGGQLRAALRPFRALARRRTGDFAGAPRPRPLDRRARPLLLAMAGRPRRAARRLQILTGSVYIERVRVRPDYGDKRKRNKRTGPGGGTRRLHQGASRQKPEGGSQKSEALSF